MELSIDEYAAIMQSDEGKETLNTKMMEMSQKRYNSRIQALYGTRNASNEYYKEVSDMSMEKFESMRTHQMSQLYEAYRERHHGNMWIKPSDTLADDVRRVVGPNARSSYNVGIMLLDQDTINAVSVVAKNKFSDDGIYRGMTAHELVRVVDEFLATRECVLQEYSLNPAEVEYSINKFANETDMLKRSVMKNVHNRENSFDIEYFKTTVADIMKRKRSLLSKAYRFFDSKLNKEKYDEARLGNITQEYTEPEL